MSTPIHYHGVSCQRDSCNWQGSSVREYEEHVQEDHR